MAAADVTITLPRDVWEAVATALTAQVTEIMEIPGDAKPGFIAKLERAVAALQGDTP